MTLPALPARAQQTQSPPAPPAPPQGPVGSVAPTPGAPPASGAPTVPPAPAAPAPPAGPPGAGPDRLDFQLKFTADAKGHGGGTAAGSAANLEYKREDYAVLSGEVQLKYQDLDLKADEVEIDLETKDVIAIGHVILDQGPRRLSGDSLTFNLEAKTGVIRHATGQVTPDYYFTGDEVDKTGDDTYVIKDGVFTSCSQQVPDWSFRVREAEVEVEGYAHVHNATMRVKKLPVFYTPYILWPVRTERSSGFLIPNIGYSERRGAELGLAYFQTLGRSYDTTFHLDTYSKGYLGVGDEFRYAPTAGTKGDFLGYSVHDPETDTWRWKLQLNHTTNDLPFGMRARHLVPEVLGLQLLPRLRARFRHQHPALHRQPRVRHRQLGAAPPQPAVRQPRDLRRPAGRHARPSATSPSSSTACARPSSARRRSTSRSTARPPISTSPGPELPGASTGASTSSRSSRCRSRPSPGSTSR